jgi:hypothetical protein
VIRLAIDRVRLQSSFGRRRTTVPAFTSAGSSLYTDVLSILVRMAGCSPMWIAIAAGMSSRSWAVGSWHRQVGSGMGYWKQVYPSSM